MEDVKQKRFCLIKRGKHKGLYRSSISGLPYTKKQVERYKRGQEHLD